MTAFCTDYALVPSRNIHQLYSRGTVGSGKVGIRAPEKKIRFVLKCPLWTVNIRFPVVVQLPSEREPYRLSDLRDEKLYLKFRNVVLELPTNDITKIWNQGRVTISASELLGFFTEVNSACQSMGGEDVQFLLVDSRNKEQSNAVRIQFNYNVHNMTCDAANLNAYSLSEQQYDGCSRIVGQELSSLEKEDLKSHAAKANSPFSVNVNLYEGQKVQRVGSREKLSSFSSQCTECSRFKFTISIGHLNLQLPSHQFCEVLYNRVVNDFYLWLWNCSLLKTLFSSHGERLADGSERSDKGKFLEMTTGDSANVLAPKPSVKEMNVCIEPNSHQDVPQDPAVDNNVAVALHSSYSASKNSKNVVVAFSLRNSTCYIEPFSDSENHWIVKLVDFFKIENYLVYGSGHPSLNAEIHIHVASTTLTYPHLDSETSLKCFVGSSDISCDFCSNPRKYLLCCILEESFLLLGTKKWSVEAVSESSGVSQMEYNFVKLISLDVLQFEISADSISSDQESSTLERLLPTFKMSCNYGLIKASFECGFSELPLFVCADSLTYLLHLLLNIAENKQHQTASTTLSSSPQSSDILIGTPFEPSYPTKLVKGSFSKETVDDSDFSHELGTSITKGESSSDCSDDDFVTVDMRSCSDNVDTPQVHLYDKEPLEIKVDFIEIPSEKNDMISSKYKNISKSVTCRVKDLSLELHIFGGNDFGPGREEEKAYSEKAFRDGNGCHQRVLEEERGGPHRDYSVHVIFDLSKLNYEYGFIKNISLSSYHYFAVKNIEVRNKLCTSQIDKVMLQYSSPNVPRRDSAPILAVRLMTNQKLERKLRISLLPIRLYLDVDTLEFLYDFYTESSSFFKDFKTKYGIARTAVCRERITISRSTDSFSHSALKICDLNRKATFDGIGLSTLSNYAAPTSQLSDEAKNKKIDSSESNLNEGQLNSDDERETDSRLEREKDELYFKEFTFSPSVLIRFDFDSQRVITNRGPLLAIITALANLQCAEIILRDLYNVDGMLGVKQCLDYALSEWTRDISTNQYTKLIGSYAPISTLLQLGKGVKDLFIMPVEEYRKEDGRIVRGLHEGAESFGFSTTTAVVDVARKVFGGIQGLAEFALDVVSPERPYLNSRTSERISHAGQDRPNDLKQGFHMALGTAKEGVLALQTEAEQSIANARRPMDYIRDFSPAFLGTVAFGSKMAVQLLDGVKSELEPDSYR
ncbi:unnamed protein product [Enterobius vermicularis]|uniref:Autophagy-related protein 2 n=1 Tax=Enterobius vermicularis TaxID=51028 RepID=A0A0N4VJU6_ENTVE|nr:unnamed protein product [Enterobius vermicularis]